MHCSRRLIVQTLVFIPSYLHRQVSPPETLVMNGGTTWARKGRWILHENARLPRNIQGSFTCRKSTTWDKRLYFPSEGRHAEEFFSLKNPTASAGFEPANWGTKGQHATSRPPKPLGCEAKHSPPCSQWSCSLLLLISHHALGRDNFTFIFYERFEMSLAVMIRIIIFRNMKTCDLIGHERSTFTAQLVLEERKCSKKFLNENFSKFFF